MTISDTPTDTASRPYHHGNLKAELLRAGMDILEEQGLDALSLRAIAARAGVSHTAPRNHFGSVRGLLTAIATEGFHRHAAFMRQGVSAASGRDARLRAAMEGYARFARTHPALFALMFSATHCDFSDPDLRAAGADSYAVLQDIAKGLDWDKSDLPGADRRAEMMLWSMVHGYALLANAQLFANAPANAAPGDPSAPGDIFSITDIMPALRYRDAG